MTKSKLAALAVCGAAAAMVRPVAADPCGMVPPMIMIDNRPAIERVGDQKTFVFHKGGTETMVLRPGFVGKVDEFGMLIPFPSVPAIRKVDDNVFPSIAAAIDPPEVIAYVQRRWPRRSRRGGFGRGARPASKSAPTDDGLRFDEVKVVKQEAVGMYDVAVLAAGSARALKKWMDSHGFKYPEGMDEVTEDYVRSRWVFVAVKTRVGQKAGVNPRAGMRAVDSKLPAGATFNGHVQAMGFRFKTDDLVVPMRLSAFNPGKLHNIVYVLTDDPVRISQIPRRFVRRQISGADLYRNVTKPLPLRVIGGTYKDLQPWQKQQLKSQRDPKPFTGVARELFAADLLAVQRRRLSNPAEEREKALLSVGEALGLRGAQIDALNAAELKKGNRRAYDQALKRLRGMTLTVIDGDFNRDTIARENLTFARYSMPNRRNSPANYDARQQGPSQRMNQGTLYHGSLAPASAPAAPRDLRRARRGGMTVGGMMRSFGLGAFVFCLGLFVLGRTQRGRTPGSLLWALVLAIGASMAMASVARAQSAQSLTSMIQQFKDPKQAEVASARIATAGTAAVDPLLDEVVDADDLAVRGWAIVTLARIGGDQANRGLAAIHASPRESMLVRTWAAAARVRMAKDAAELAGLGTLVGSFPAVARPYGLKAAALIRDARTAEQLEHVLALPSQVPAAARHTHPALLAMKPRRLVRAAFRSRNDQARRVAVSYLATQAQADPKSPVAARTIAALNFDPDATAVPWDGGALFLPALAWNKADATRLADRLMRWFVWADAAGNAALQRQIHNNLRVGVLAQAAGYVAPSWNASSASVDEWLVAWGRVVGKDHIARILRQQGLHKTRRYRRLLTRI